MGLGFAVGIQHAFEPDHVSAISTQMLKSKIDKKPIKQLIKQSITKSSILGAVWGAGHTTTLVLIGFLVYALAITIHDHIFSGFEFAVGMMLVFLGITTIINKKFDSNTNIHINTKMEPYILMNIVMRILIIDILTNHI